MDDKALRFPASAPAERVIQTEQVKEAVGLASAKEFPSLEEPEMLKPLPSLRMAPRPALLETPLEEPETENTSVPLYLHVDVYKQILDAMTGIRGHLVELQEANKHLEKSEYNEEHNFDRLRKSVKSIHDRFLHMDKIIFKN